MGTEILKEIVFNIWQHVCFCFWCVCVL